jgi:hypothetical protein
MKFTGRHEFRAVVAGLLHFSVLGVARFSVGDALTSSDWSTYQHDAAHTGRGSGDFDPALLQKAWGSTQYFKAMVAGDSVYGIRGDGQGSSLAAFNLSNGQQKWSKGWSDTYSSWPTYADGMLVAVAFSSPNVNRLSVFDAATGTQKYTVAVPAITNFALPPTVARNSNNQLVAYLADSNSVTAVSLGANSGSVMWTNSVSLGVGFSIPTLVGNSVVVAGPGHYYALDQLTGTANSFFSVSTGGGSGVTVSYDAARAQLYVRDGDANLLTAFSYTNNNVISQMWQTAPHGHTSVAIGLDGGVYGISSSSIYEWSSEDGHVIRSISGLQLSSGFCPALSDNALFAYSNDGVNKYTEVYDLQTLVHIKTLSHGQLNANTPTQSPGAVFNGGYVLYYDLNGAGSGGFDVYFAVPEPATIYLALLAVAFFSVGARRC